MAALIFSMIDHECRVHTIPNELTTYKMHLCWLVKELLVPNTPPINKEKEIDKYCNELKNKLLDKKTWNETLENTCNLFINAQQEWIQEKGDSYKYGIKDSVDFFNYLRFFVYSRKQVDIIEDKPLQYRGVVIKVGVDRNGRAYGFISRKPDNIFFHEQDNPDLEFSTLNKREVLYNITQDINGNEKAINVVLI